MHTHHIIPEYVFNHSAATPADLEFKNSQKNLVFLSIEDHIIAHQLLYEVYGNKQDCGAILILTGQLAEASRVWKQLGAWASHNVQEENERQFWNQEFQKEMARLFRQRRNLSGAPAPLSSMARPDALLIRSVGGKIGGKTTKLNVAIKPHERFTFLYQGEAKVSLFNSSLGSQVLEVLNAVQPSKLQRATPLLNGSRKNLNGWSCVRLPDGPVLPDKYLKTLADQSLGLQKPKS
jgi:hypothetical protein